MDYGKFHMDYLIVYDYRYLGYVENQCNRELKDQPKSSMISEHEHKETAIDSVSDRYQIEWITKVKKRVLTIDGHLI